MPKPETTRMPAEEIQIGDIIHKQRDIWFRVHAIERSGDYIRFHDETRRHWKNYRHDSGVTKRPFGDQDG